MGVKNSLLLIMPRQNFSKIDSLPEKDLKQIQSLVINGYSFKYIFEWIETRGFKVSLKTVQNWHKKYLESVKGNSETASKALSAINKQERDTTPDPTIDNPEDLERIKNEWGIKDLESINDFEDYIRIDGWDVEASEKMITDLFFDVGILTKNRINLNKKGLAKFPNEQIRSMKLLFDMYFQIRQVADRVSGDAAIKTINTLRKRVKNWEDYDLLESDNETNGSD